MKPAPFDYLRGHSIGEVVEALAAAGAEGKIIAGGQSLLPMMNFRLVRPAVLIDINSIAHLSTIEQEGDQLRLGATVRHRMTEANVLIGDKAPIVRSAMSHVAHLTVRNRGTFCGSICHADPAAELPLIALLLNAKIEACSVRGNRRIPAAEFFIGPLVNALQPDELVRSITIDTLAPDAGWAFEEFARRHGDFAIACAAIILRLRDGVATEVRFGATGVGETPLRLAAVEALVEGREFSPRLLGDVTELLNDTLEPITDLQASADYRRHLMCGLTRRALENAWHRARRAVEKR